MLGYFINCKLSSAFVLLAAPQHVLLRKDAVQLSPFTNLPQLSEEILFTSYQMVAFSPFSPKESPICWQWRKVDGNQMGEINGCHAGCLFSWELRLWRLTLADGEINTPLRARCLPSLWSASVGYRLSVQETCHISGSPVWERARKIVIPGWCRMWILRILLPVNAIAVSRP